MGQHVWDLDSVPGAERVTLRSSSSNRSCVGCRRTLTAHSGPVISFWYQKFCSLLFPGSGVGLGLCFNI